MKVWRKPYTLRHFQKKKVKRGYAANGYTDMVVELDVQPLSTKELEALPEGQRSKHRIKTFGDYAIQTADQKAGIKPDRLFYSGKWYECEVSEPWVGTRLGHYFSQFVEAPEAETDTTPAAKGGGEA